MYESMGKNVKNVWRLVALEEQSFKAYSSPNFNIKHLTKRKNTLYQALNVVGFHT